MSCTGGSLSAATVGWGSPAAPWSAMGAAGGGRGRVRVPTEWILASGEIQLPDRDLEPQIGRVWNGSPEIRTQDQSVKSQSWRPKNTFAHRVESQEVQRKHK